MLGRGRGANARARLSEWELSIFREKDRKRREEIAAEKAKEAEGKPPPEEWILGLDLGQAQDFSALVALCKQCYPGRDCYIVRGCRRWPKGTLYTEIAASTALTASKLPGCTLGVDYTGVGRGVVEMIYGAKPAAKVVPINITAGRQVSANDAGGYNVAKIELVSAVSAVLQSGRITIPVVKPDASGRMVPWEETKLLVKELQGFRVKVSAKTGNESFENDWRTAPHDDLCIGLSICCFLGERGKKKLQIWM